MENNRTLLFVRVSSLDQSYTRQLSDLQKFCASRGLKVTDTITEKISGATKNKERAAIQELLQKARRKEFDKIAITELSRIGRSPKEVIDIISELAELKISLLVMDLNVETLDPSGKMSIVAELLVHVISVFTKLERTTMIERVHSGIRQAKAKGVHCGRPQDSKESPEAFLKKYSKVAKDLKAGISLRKVARLHEISVVTAMKVKTMMNSNQPTYELRTV